MMWFAHAEDAMPILALAFLAFGAAAMVWRRRVAGS